MDIYEYIYIYDYICIFGWITLIHSADNCCFQDEIYGQLLGMIARIRIIIPVTSQRGLIETLSGWFCRSRKLMSAKFKTCVNVTCSSFFSSYYKSWGMCVCVYIYIYIYIHIYIYTCMSACMHQEEGICANQITRIHETCGWRIRQNHRESVWFPSAFRIEPDEDPLQMFAYLGCERLRSSPSRMQMLVNHYVFYKVYGYIVSSSIVHVKKYHVSWFCWRHSPWSFAESPVFQHPGVACWWTPPWSVEMLTLRELANHHPNYWSNEQIENNWLVVGPPLWKIWKSIGMIIPNIWENRIDVPNHQPEIYAYIWTHEQKKDIDFLTLYRWIKTYLQPDIPNS